MKTRALSDACAFQRAASAAIGALALALPIAAFGDDAARTVTPIKHIVVIFQEN
jgi:phospholipase C